MNAREIVVAQHGLSDFREISAALSAAQGATRNDPVNIVIRGGVYEETLTTRDWVNLIGDDRDSCVVRCHGGDGDVVGKHVIWAASNTVIRNLSIVGIQVKYAIHSDAPGTYLLRLENCAVRREYPGEYPKTHVKAFGVGLHAGQHVVMQDCCVEADIPVYFHNGLNELAPCSITLERCVLKGKECAMDIFLLGSGQRDVLVIHDSILDGETGILYRNARNVAWAPAYHGRSEMELVGSGNRIAGINGAPMRDDSHGRCSGIELAQKGRKGP